MEGNKRFLHLMHDNNFVDYFIDQSEEVMESVSDYWIINDGNQVRLNSIHPKGQSVKWDISNLPGLIKKANGYSKIILHSFFISNLKLFLNQVSKDIQIVWVFWGGDGYSYTYDLRRWYLPISWKMKQKSLDYSSNPILSWINSLRNKRYHFKKSLETQQLIRKVDVCATWIKHDYEMIKHINPKMKWAFYSYYTFEQLNLSELEYTNPDFSRLLLGNSATDTNNHFDALDFLKSVGYKGKIVVPLSYGSKSYAESVVDFGKRYFGEKFIPITELIPLDEYQKIINSCGIVWMNHIRQQAAGNIIAALYLGKAVILNRENPIYKTFKEVNVNFANDDVLKSPDLINPEDFKVNKKIIENFFSKERILKGVESLYER